MTMKKQFTEGKIQDWSKLTEEQAIRVVLGDKGLFDFEDSDDPDDHLWLTAHLLSIKKLQLNPISLHINSLAYAAIRYYPEDKANIYGVGLLAHEPEGAAIISYFNFKKDDGFFYTKDRDEPWKNSVPDGDCLKGIPVLEEIVEWVLVESDFNDWNPPEYVEKAKQGKSLNPNGFSGDERISKDALTAIILLGNIPMGYRMWEIGLWSIQRPELREIICTIFAYNYRSPEHVQIVAREILKELNPEFIEYIEFVNERIIESFDQ